MGEVSIKSGNVDVLHHGSVMSFNDQPISIDVGFISIRFEREKEKKQRQGYRFEISETETVITLLSLRASRYPIATQEPIYLGTTLNKEGIKSELYFNFQATWFQGTSSILIHFTLYKEPQTP